MILYKNTSFGGTQMKKDYSSLLSLILPLSIFAVPYDVF